MGHKKIGVSTSTNPEDYPDTHVVIKLDKAVKVPSLDVGSPSDPFVKVVVGEKKDGEKDHGQNVFVSSYKEDNSDPVWNEVFDLGEVALNDPVRVELWDYDTIGADDLIGFAEIKVADLIRRPSLSTLLSMSDGRIVVKNSRHAPTELRFSVVKVPASMPQPKESPNLLNKGGFPKHVMIISRGTQGDIQPFVALARGLAEQLNWMVTIVTEIRFKDFVKSNAKVSAGAIRFRPSGGDTASRIDTPLAKWAMQNKSEFMQTAMLARSEREFFDSEPAIFHWAQDLRPDALIYGFTMANIASIVSEALRIPMLGFVLQPTVIPSKRYSAVTPISSHALSVIDKMEEKTVGHDFQARLKQLMENGPFEAGLNDMRKSRGLRPFKGSESETWRTILEQNSPVVIPINQVCFGGKPEDWPATVELTDFIFLRKGGVPPIPEKMMTFIETAKKAQAPLLVMAFSSMPVDRERILSLAVLMATKCAKQPRVIALVGNRDLSKEKLSKSLEEKVTELKNSGRIFEDKGAPFGELFKHMDCVIIHGGLGTTAEALRAAKPTMVTGVLLMDQRFWGKQCFELGVGPEPVHISDFHEVCVKNVDIALDDTSVWRVNAEALASKIQGRTEDGVAENVEAIDRLLQTARPISD